MIHVGDWQVWAWQVAAWLGKVSFNRECYGLLFVSTNWREEMFTTIEVEIRGISPLLMHNGQMADPMNKFSRAMKEISGKRKKTDADFEEMARLEWHGGLYINADGFAIIPSTGLESCITDGAKLQKLGKLFQSGMFVESDAVLNFPGKRKAEQLWGDDNFRDTRGVKIQKNRIMRTRPIFREWSAKFEVGFDDQILNAQQVMQAIREAGLQKGLLDYRPKFGRFELVEQE